MIAPEELFPVLDTSSVGVFMHLWVTGIFIRKPWGDTHSKRLGMTKQLPKWQQYCPLHLCASGYPPVQVVPLLFCWSHCKALVLELQRSCCISVSGWFSNLLNIFVSVVKVSSQPLPVTRKPLICENCLLSPIPGPCLYASLWASAFWALCPHLLCHFCISLKAGPNTLSSCVLVILSIR